ncbi:MAG: hypothetical protein Q7S64_00435 [bacterium]|nr:hypothetical protein [bacterium]
MDKGASTKDNLTEAANQGRKKISWLTIGALLLLIIIIFGVSWTILIRSQQVQTQTASSTQTSDWKQYKDDVLGIQFDYPQKWGNPRTEPKEHITDLAHVVDEFTGNNGYHNNFRLVFTQENSPQITIFNDAYENENEPASYYDRGLAGNVSKLKQTGDICQYQLFFIPFNPRNDNREENLFREVQSTCKRGIKETLTQFRQDFRYSSFPEVGLVYSYNLSLLAYHPLQNGSFNHALVRSSLGYTGQIADASMTINQFLTVDKGDANYQVSKSVITDADYDLFKSDFARFNNSLKSYPPPKAVKAAFKETPGEDPNLTVIRRYYYAISNKDLVAAYGYYQDQKVSFAEFTKWYQNTYYANPTQFEKTGTNQYRFMVDFQDSNQDPLQYRVTMQVTGGKLKPLSSEKLIGETDTYQKQAVFAARRNNKSYILLSINKQEQVIDEADAPSEETGFSGETFTKPQFSPNGNFISYGVIGWEWYGTRVYDIKKQKIIFKEEDGGNDFTPDEKYYYGCATNQFGGSAHGFVYQLPEFTKLYELFDDKQNQEYMSVDCKYDKAKQVINFTLTERYNQDGTATKPDQKRVIQYSLTDKKEHVAQP